MYEIALESERPFQSVFSRRDWKQPSKQLFSPQKLGISLKCVSGQKEHSVYKKRIAYQKRIAYPIFYQFFE